MKKVLLGIFVLFLFFSIGCISEINQETPGKVISATVNEMGIVIDEEEITTSATFLNYEVDGITVGFIVVRGTDGIVRVAFNTCQSCTPSPDAYFIQKGEYFECQNCGNRFHVDQIGTSQGGCNPAPVKEMLQEEGMIIISTDEADNYKKNFENWNGQKI